MDIFTPVFNKRELGKALKKAQKGVVAYITELCKERLHMLRFCLGPAVLM